MIGNIPEKDLAMLEERIKRSSKSRPQEPEPIGTLWVKILKKLTESKKKIKFQTAKKAVLTEELKLRTEI